MHFCRRIGHFERGLEQAEPGALGQALAGYSLGGCVISTIVGFVGAYIGTWLARSFNLPIFVTLQVGGEDFPLVWAIIGSALLAAIVGLITGRRARAV